MNYGFIKNEVEEEAYVFGSGELPREILREDGQWDDFLPEYEPQFNLNFDTSACTIFGTINAVEILEKRIFNTSPNYSERFHYNLIPLRPPGGDPHAAAESVRKRGMVDQELLPMTETFNEYILPEPMPRSIIQKGTEWLQTHEFGHEYLWRGNPSQEAKNSLLKGALQYSPVGVSVTAWQMGPDGLYVDGGRPNVHWCVLIGYRYRDDGAFIRRVFDTYDHEVKELDPSHNIEVAKRYHLAVRVYNDEDKSDGGFIRKLINIIHGFYKKFFFTLPVHA